MTQKLDECLLKVCVFSHYRCSFGDYKVTFALRESQEPSSWKKNRLYSAYLLIEISMLAQIRFIGKHAAEY